MTPLEWGQDRPFCDKQTSEIRCTALCCFCFLKEWLASGTQAIQTLERPVLGRGKLCVYVCQRQIFEEVIAYP